ncbi:hypothetical protein [Candidatus Stoquefichus sp. SB1]|uniref:Uncharacterized protein n=1 Tax=Caudovirales sp. ct7oE3 TaxID=2826768 RepID=A0A8S5LZM4_9CAUD|nr:hypothetical protein [Candidatus Stoquefichus sp. SB1]DAD75398.1 MAG TPA: Protein of unknown function (DUF806) [Caudovirales sp. ct7oE3]
MINHESQNYTLITQTLKQVFEEIQLTDQKLRFYQGTYPVVSFVQTNNYVLKDSLGFDDIETMNYEEYEIEIQSDKDMDEIRNIFNHIDNAMHQLGYIRTYCGLDTQDKETKLKRLMQYQTAL